MFSVRLSSFRYNNTAIVELYANNKEVVFSIANELKFSLFACGVEILLLFKGIVHPKK